jgi:diguanylate cyclase (GGDEF)-like protein
VVGAHGQVVHCTASLGVADSQQHGLALPQLLSRADAAMYAAKQAGRNRVRAAEADRDGRPR